MNDKERPTLVIDAANTVLGRLASFAAKQALLGKNIIVVNCGEALVTGNPSNIMDEYRIARQRGGASLNGPNFPKHSERLVKRTIRGMLYFRHGRGKDAFKRVKCYNDIPQQFDSQKKQIAAKPLRVKTMKLSEISRGL